MASNGKKVVCIEDDSEMIDLIQLILGRRGYEVVGAVGGEAGVETVIREMPDLILLDLMMPEVDGWDAYHRIKANELSKSIPVIVVTAKAQEIDKILGLHIARVDDYITKPFSPKDLVDRIEALFARIDG